MPVKKCRHVCSPLFFCVLNSEGGRIKIADNITIELDGVQLKLQPPDIDGDGKRGGVETLTKHASLEGNVSFVQQKSELAQSIEKLDDDTVDPVTKMSNIDMNAHLSTVEKNADGVIDFLVSVGFLPSKTMQLTRQLKRLSVSVDGVGRKQKVAMVTGEREHQKQLGGSMMDKVKGFFSGNKEER